MNTTFIPSTLLAFYAFACAAAEPSYSQAIAQSIEEVTHVSAVTTPAKSHGSWQQSAELMQQQVSTAILAFEATSRKQWAFDVSHYENEEGDITSSEERYQPNEDATKQWTLLKLNGEVPSDKQAKKFQKKKAEQLAKKSNGSINIKLRDMISINTLSFVFEDDVKAIADFNVHLERLGEKASKQLTGQLTYNKQGQFIERIAIKNIGPFSPIFSAKITDFKMNIHFQKIAQAVLPHENNLAMKGRFALFTQIDEVSTDRYYNYRYQPADDDASKEKKGD
ncbi:MAG: hypothetical protein MK214_04160 [Thalassotalea sp.]|nr:hypothetical protein [Thalassotalea sp.]